MSVRRNTTNRLTLFRTCGTCGRSIVTTADTPWVRQVERDTYKRMYESLLDRMTMERRAGA